MIHTVDSDYDYGS